MPDLIPASGFDSKYAYDERSRSKNSVSDSNLHSHSGSRLCSCSCSNLNLNSEVERQVGGDEGELEAGDEVADDGVSSDEPSAPLSSTSKP